jgi:hypothetical protein
MKNYIIALLLTLYSALTFSQGAKKPILMLMPSDGYCKKMGWGKEIDEMGTKKFVPDYTLAYTNDFDLKAAEASIAEMFLKRGFEIKSLNKAIEEIQNSSVEESLLGTDTKNKSEVIETPLDKIVKSVKPDIILEVFFEIKRSSNLGYYTNFSLIAIDSYTKKIIASSSGTGVEVFEKNPAKMISEAVQENFDNFQNQLTVKFTDMITKGREVKLVVKLFDACPFKLNDEFSYPTFQMEDEELITIIKEWVRKNTVGGRFNLQPSTSTNAVFEQVMIPLFIKNANNEEVAVDASDWANGLRKILKKEPFNQPVKMYTRGLGEIWVIIGDK